MKEKLKWIAIGLLWVVVILGIAFIISIVGG